jgi:type I restriction enzyme, S subunit
MNAVLEKKSSLPDGWQSLAIEDIAEINPRVNKSEISDHLVVSFVPMPAVEAESGAIDVSQERPFLEVKKGFTPFKEGDVLFAKITPCMENGKMAVVPKVKNGYGFGSTEFHVLRPKEGIESKYIYYFVSSRTFRGVAQHHMSGAVGQKRVPTNYLKQHLIPVAPPEQQKRIVAKIEELFSHIDAGIEALKKAKQLLKQYRQSVLKAAVTGELTKEWREANTAKLEPASQLLERILETRRQLWEEQQLEQFKAKGRVPNDDKWKDKYKELSQIPEEELEKLAKLPSGWIYTRLGNVIEEPKYGTSKKCTYVSKGIGVLRIPNVSNGVIDSGDLKFANFDDSEIETYKLNVGDILTIRSNGSISLVGKCALIGEKDTNYLYAGYLIRLRPNSKVVASSYLNNIFDSIFLRNQIESKAKSTSGVNNINSGELQSLIIPICNIIEQDTTNALVDEKIGSIKRLLSEIDHQLVKAEKSKQSILASLFTGLLK